jgi:amino-acid N-acetyltransferase
MNIRIEGARPEDWPPLAALLAANQLPLDGLAEHLDSTLVAHHGAELVGSAAIEPYGSAALLRSVAVAPAYRGVGLGQQLTQAALKLARARGMDEVYLLTETAATFFPRFGFAPVARDEVAVAVRQSVEFQSACPASALVMRADLS